MNTFIVMLMTYAIYCYYGKYNQVCGVKQISQSHKSQMAHTQYILLYMMI